MARIQGKKVLIVVASQNFRDEEYQQPRQALEAEGAEVKVGAREVRAACRGMLGLTVTPDVMLRDARGSEFDGVVVVGGAGAQQYLWTDSELMRVLREAKAGGKVIGGICLGCAALAKAGVLRGVEATVFPTRDSLKEMQAGGARYVKRDLVVSGRIITADGPEMARDFGKKLVEALAR